MTAIYNEVEPYACDWLENLINAGHIAHGQVDRRSIKDLGPGDVAGGGQRHFFAGIGGWSHALRLVGWPDDVPVWTGSCPCQPFSPAGRQEGVLDERHLWPDWFRLIRECRPAIIFGEQVASALAWLDGVSTDLEREGYAVGAADLCAAGVGAPHVRQRLYFVAHSGVAGLEGLHEARRRIDLQPTPLDVRRQWEAEPSLARLADGTPARVGRTRAVGNLIVPQVAATFIRAALEAA